MRKLASLFLAACFLLLSAQTTEIFNVYVNGLPVATSLGATDQFYVRQGGTSKQVPFSVLPQGSVTVTGTPTTGDCAKFATATSISDAGTCGDVASVAVTTPTGLGVAGSPCTGVCAIVLSWSGTIPNAQIPTPTATAPGGVEAVTCASGLFFNVIPTNGIPTCATPAGGGNVSTSGTITSGGCAQFNSTTTIVSVSPCNSGGGGSSGGFTNYVNIKTYGATGDGTCHALSTAYGSLAAAQAVYPFVSDLTQCIDWAAWQQAINVAYTAAPNGLSGQQGMNAVYCPSGVYALSNPLIADIPNNTAGTASAWASGTTYGNGAIVKYNGLPMVSAGSGNVGNPPTLYDLFPSNIQPGGFGNYPTASIWAAVTISNASPAVFTINTTGGFSGSQGNVTANMPLVVFTQQFAAPGGSSPALPTGINPNQVYYVIGSSINNSAGTFQVSATPGGSAVNTSSAGVGNFFVSGQVWQFAPDSSGTQFVSRVSLIGDAGMTGNAGCLLQTQFNWSSPAVVIGPQNGILIQNISLVGQVVGGTQGSPGNVGYRCTAPYANNGPAQATGGNVAAVGWAVMSNGGGATRTKLENVGAFGFYFADVHSYGTNGEIADHNTWQNVSFQGTCVGLNMAATQAFINGVHDSTIGMTTTGVYANLQEGVKVDGGDFSTFDALSNSFAITSVSTSSSCGTMFLCVTATITSPDTNFQQPMCAYSAGQANSTGNTIWPNAWPFASGCGYNTFIIKTAQWGAVPMYIMNYNPFTFVATFGIPKSYNAIYNGNCCGSNFTSEITAATTLYAVEATMPFFGNSQIDTIHLENDGVPYTLSCFCTTFFGGVRPVELKNVYLNVEASLSGGACCNQSQTTKAYYRFLAQQVIPFINSSSGDTIVDHLTGGGITQAAGGTISALGPDRILLATGIGNYVEMRHTTGTAFNNGQSTGSSWNAQAPLFDFYPREEYAIPLVGSTQGQLSGGYISYGGQAYGSGMWDNGSQLGPFSELSLSSGGQPTDMFNQWATKGWGQAPQWGVRPAPYTNPCILPSQATSLGSLPAITYNANLQDLVQVASGGSGYNNGDTITLAGGTFSSPAVLQVTGTSSGAVTSVKTNGGNGGNYSQVPAGGANFTQSSTSGSGSGATFVSTGNVWFVNYVIGYPRLWGGHLYHACSYNNVDFGSHGSLTNALAIKSTHQAYSYFQNLTTTNVGGFLAGGGLWSMDGASPFINMSYGALQLMFPGLQFNLTGSGSCSGTENFIVLEVHPTLGYVKVVRADTDGSGFVPALAASGTTCTGSTIGMASPSLVFPY